MLCVVITSWLPQRLPRANMIFMQRCFSVSKNCREYYLGLILYSPSEYFNNLPHLFVHISELKNNMWPSVIRWRPIDSLKQLKMSSFLFPVLIYSKSTWYFVQGLSSFLVIFCCCRKQQSLSLDCCEALAPVNRKWRLLCSCFCFFSPAEEVSGEFLQ